MENNTYNSPTLRMEGLHVTETSVYPLFLVFLLSYLFIVFANGGILVVICMDRSLHQPMYLLLCNLLINDIYGNSIVLPRLIADILMPPSKRLINYYACVVQAFTVHWFATANHTVLMIMAIDRCVAICNPLRYTSIMSNTMVIKLIVSAWGSALVLVAILLGLTIRLNRCRTLISNAYCDNASLFKLSCESVFINNVYGLTFTAVLRTASIGTIVFTYSKIAAVCLTSNNKSLNSKALITCSTHLSVYIILFVTGLINIALHRLHQHSDAKTMSILVYLILPAGLNPIIYGGQSKEIRKGLMNMLKVKKVLPSFLNNCG